MVHYNITESHISYAKEFLNESKLPIKTQLRNLVKSFTEDGNTFGMVKNIVGVYPYPEYEDEPTKIILLDIGYLR